MAIEDVNGYKPHTDEKVQKVNQIKDVENAMGAILDNLDKELLAELISCQLDKVSCIDVEERRDQVKIAKQKLKESSMWACRAVFRPEEKY